MPEADKPSAQAPVDAETAAETVAEGAPEGAAEMSAQPLKIVLVYAACSALWILFSDQAVQRWWPDPGQMALVATAKGLGLHGGHRGRVVRPCCTA